MWLAGLLIASETQINLFLLHTIHTSITTTTTRKMIHRGMLLMIDVKFEKRLWKIPNNPSPKLYIVISII